MEFLHLSIPDLSNKSDISIIYRYGEYKNDTKEAGSKISEQIARGAGSVQMFGDGSEPV